MTEKEWEKYEEAARYLLNNLLEHLGLSKVGKKQKVKGKKSGTYWEVDFAAYNEEDSKLVLVECKRYSKRGVPQDKVAAFAYRIEDTDAARGIIVTPIGLQKGGRKIADAEKITTVKLDKNSTIESYAAQVANHIFIKPPAVTVSVSTHVGAVIVSKKAKSEHDNK